MEIPYAEVYPRVDGKIKIEYSSPDEDMTFDFESTSQKSKVGHNISISCSNF